MEYSREIIRRGNFEAWEIVVGDGGGAEAIFKGISFYNELLKEGHSIGLMGTSDCHDAAAQTGITADHINEGPQEVAETLTRSDRGDTYVPYQRFAQRKRSQ